MLHHPPVVVSEPTIGRGAPGVVALCSPTGRHAVCDDDQSVLRTRYGLVAEFDLTPPWGSADLVHCRLARKDMRLVGKNHQTRSINRRSITLGIRRPQTFFRSPDPCVIHGDRPILFRGRVLRPRPE